MREKEPKREDESEHLRCIKCKKVLAKHFSSGYFEIKCPRCDTVNVIEKK